MPALRHFRAVCSYFPFLHKIVRNISKYGCRRSVGTHFMAPQDILNKVKYNRTHNTLIFNALQKAIF